MTTHTWATPVNLPDGHRLFETHFGRFAIADDSGETPDQTSDGVLWLDTSRPLTVGKNVYEGHEYMMIPLTDKDGRKTSTITNAATMLFLSQHFGMTIYNDASDRSFKVILA